MRSKLHESLWQLSASDAVPVHWLAPHLYVQRPNDSDVLSPNQQRAFYIGLGHGQVIYGEDYSWTLPTSSIEWSSKRTNHNDRLAQEKSEMRTFCLGERSICDQRISEPEPDVTSKSKVDIPRRTLLPELMAQPVFLNESMVDILLQTFHDSSPPVEGPIAWRVYNFWQITWCCGGRTRLWHVIDLRRPHKRIISLFQTWARIWKNYCKSEWHRT